MNQFRTPSKAAIKELSFQLVLHLIVFSFYAIRRKSPQVEEFELIFFLNLSLAAFLINYILLPRFLFREKYVSFVMSVLLIITGTVLLEEQVLEKIYFPDTRGKSFPGVFYTLMGILPVITILTGFKFAWDAFIKQREVSRLKQAVKESELQFLKSQINPHFLFNNLNNLYSFAIENSPRTPEIILELSAVLRYMLYDCKVAFVSLSKELGQIQNFIKISELQIEDRGVVSLNINNGKQDYKIAPLLLIVFIENAFKHSTASQSKDINIDINIEVDDSGKLKFRCINSFEKYTNTDNLSKGIGLENVKKRLQLIYPNAHRLSIENDNEYFRVELIIQLKQ